MTLAGCLAGMVTPTRAVLEVNTKRKMRIAAVVLMVPAFLIYSKSLRLAAHRGYRAVAPAVLRAASKMPIPKAQKDKLVQLAEDVGTPRKVRCVELYGRPVELDEIAEAFIKATKCVGTIFKWFVLFADADKDSSSLG